jgi:O-antigen/teichoic acid export membrane protein
MGSIRKQTILSSILIYAGFAIGALNMYLFTRTGEGSFTTAQYGLTRIFFDFGQIIYIFSSFGVIPVIYKFYPYYKDNLEEHKIDLMTWAMAVSLAGFVLAVIAGWYFEPLFVRKYSEKSKLIVDYYHLMFPFALGMLLFSVLESFGWAIQKAVAANFLKETVLRIFTTVFILLYYFKVLNFNQFVYLFATLYFIIFIFLFIYLKQLGKLHFSFSVSRVTKRFWRKMVRMQSFLLGGNIINSISSTIDGFLIAGFRDLGAVGIFTFAQYAANLIQVPQRSIQSVAVSHLSRAWKDKNYAEINRIYARSCINLLLLGLFIFGNVWLNVKPGIQLLHLNTEYLAGLTAILIISFARLVDTGTGVNGTVIGTSTFWKFDFTSGVVLLSFRLPLTWILIKNYGIIGSACAELISLSVYNFIRFEFIRRKFGMQPFSFKTVYSILLAVTAYFVCYFLLKGMESWMGIVLRVILFSSLMLAGIFYFKLTPDAIQVWDGLKKKFLKS